MMTLEHLAEQKAVYQAKVDYFKNISLDILAANFQGVVDLISNMEEYVKEKENDQN